MLMFALYVNITPRTLTENGKKTYCPSYIERKCQGWNWCSLNAHLKWKVNSLNEESIRTFSFVDMTF